MADQSSLLEMLTSRLSQVQSFGIGPLTRAEQALLVAAETGETAVCGPSSAADTIENDPANADSWDEQRTIRAFLIEWLCKETTLRQRVSPTGLWVLGARIRDSIDLCNVNFPFPLGLIRCSITKSILLNLAEVKLLSLDGSWIGSMFGDRLRTASDLLLRKGFRAIGPVRLVGAQIGGNLDCNSGRFEAASRDALVADRVAVAGSVKLGFGFRAAGAVKFCGARIDGSLDCTAGHFAQLDATGAQVRGSVLFRNGASPAMNIVIGPLADAILDSLEPTYVKGDVVRFEADDTIRLTDARVDGDIDCCGGRFGGALIADRTVVGGSINLGCFGESHFESTGGVVLAAASVGRDIDCGGALIEKRDGSAINLSGASVCGSVNLDKGFLSVGTVDLFGARLGGQLTCVGHFICGEKAEALRIDGAEVKGSILLGRVVDRTGFITSITVASVTGIVRAIGASIGGDFVIFAWFSGDSPNGLIAQTMRVNGRLRWEAECNDQTKLDLRDANVASLILNDNDKPPQNGSVCLRGLTYRDIESGESVEKDGRRLSSTKTALRWLERMDEFNEQPYQQLASVLDAKGMEEQARVVRIAKEDCILQHGEIGRGGRFRKRISKATIGYGYQPWRAVIPALIVVLIGWGVVAAGDSAGLMRPTKTDEVAVHKPLSPALYSLDMFLPVVNLRQKDYWWPDATKPCGAALRIYLWLHIVAGWVLTTLFLAGLTGVVRRK